MKDPDGNVHKLNILQAIVRENAQGWTRLTDSQAREHFGVSKPSASNKRTEDITTKRQLEATNQQPFDYMFYNVAVSSESHHSSSHCHDSDSSSSHSSDSSYDYSGGHSDCGAGDPGF